MDDRRLRLLRIAAAVGVLLLLAILVGPQGEQDPSADPRMSSYLTTDAGTRGIFLALSEMGYPVERHRRRWSSDDTTGSLMLLAPTFPPDSLAVEELLEWVDRGGTLVLGMSEAAAGLAERLGPQLRTRRVEDPDAEGAIAHAADHRWTAGVDSVSGVRSVFLTPDPDRVAEFDLLLATETGSPVVVAFERGAGRVVAWSDPGMLSNDRLRRQAAPATIAMRAAVDGLIGTVEAGAAVEAGARVEAGATENDQDRAVAMEFPVIRFDEFHHGFRGDGSPARALREFITGTGTGMWLLQALVAALALLLLAGHRFGAPIPERAVRGRAPLEHMEALAAVYRKAGADRTTRSLLLAGLNRRLGQRIELTDTNTLRLPRSLEQYPAGTRLMEEWRRGDKADVEALSRAMDDLISEAMG